MRPFILAPLLLVASLNAGTYDENYRVTNLKETIKPNDNVFMSGDFEQIIRFNMINMDSNKNNSNEIIDEVVKKIKELQNAGKAVKITIIGHTDRATNDANELSIDSNTYANKIQNWFKYELDTNSAKQKSKDYAQEIKDKMIDANLSKDILFTEYRGGLDQGFSAATTEGRDLSNRVMVALYVYELPDIDSDRDGVFDRIDKCPNSARGFIVDTNGCPVDSDGDGVFDYKDQCPKTPKDVAVDTQGCPLDLDKDGVFDYKDSCLKTPLGLKVDPKGCPLKSNLHLNFKTASDKILKESYSEIVRFAQFMKENPKYKAQIIGHTDSSGKAVKNMALSKRRAESTIKALVSEGVLASRLSATGRGELDPIESNRTKEGRQANRRIEVQLSLIQ